MFLVFILAGWEMERGANLSLSASCLSFIGVLLYVLITGRQRVKRRAGTNNFQVMFLQINFITFCTANNGLTYFGKRY